MSDKTEAKENKTNKTGSHTGLGSPRSTYSSEARGPGGARETWRTRRSSLSRIAISSRGASGSLHQEMEGAAMSTNQSHTPSSSSAHLE